MEEFKAQVYKARSFDRPSPFVRSVDLQTSRYDWLWNAVDRLTIGCGMSILFTPRTHTECAARRRMRLTDQFSCPGLFFFHSWMICLLLVFNQGVPVYPQPYVLPSGLLCFCVIFF